MTFMRNFHPILPLADDKHWSAERRSPWHPICKTLKLACLEVWER